MDMILEDFIAQTAAQKWTDNGNAGVIFAIQTTP